MDSEPGRTLILWTVRGCVVFYCVSVLLWRRVRRSRSDHSAYIATWTASWVLCLVHVVCAYHFEHQWSQAAALRHTAELTEKVVGIHWSGGLYVNYLFLFAWGIDVVQSWKKRRPSPGAMQVAAAFMMFNATVVFGPGWWLIPAGLFVVLLFADGRESDDHGTAVE